MRNGCSSCWVHSLSDRLCCFRCYWICPEWSEEYCGAKSCRVSGEWTWRSALSHFTVMMEDFRPVCFTAVIFISPAWQTEQMNFIIHTPWHKTRQTLGRLFILKRKRGDSCLVEIENVCISCQVKHTEEKLISQHRIWDKDRQRYR